MHAIAFGRARGQHDDRRLGGGRTGTKQSTDFEAAQHRQIEIENDQIGRLLAGGLQRLVAAAGDLDDGVARSLERVFDEAGDVVFVFDDEHARLVDAARPLPA